MKKHQNLKIRPAYKTLAMILLFGLAGCKQYEPKNVITRIETVDGVKVLEINDVETGITRMYKITKSNANDREKWLRVGDTVTLSIGGLLYDGKEYYQKHLVLTSSDAFLEYNLDSIFARQERKKFNDIKQKMYDENQR